MKKILNNNYITLSKKQLDIFDRWYSKLHDYIPTDKGIDFINEYQWYVKNNEIKPYLIINKIIRPYWKELLLKEPITLYIIFLMYN